LHWAAYGRHLHIARLLVENGASVSALENSGKSAYALARGDAMKQFLKEQEDLLSEKIFGFKRASLHASSDDYDDFETTSDL
jgi:ankyrin repeat protein